MSLFLTIYFVFETDYISEQSFNVRIFYSVKLYSLSTRNIALNTFLSHTQIVCLSDAVLVFFIIAISGCGPFLLPSIIGCPTGHWAILQNATKCKFVF